MSALVEFLPTALFAFLEQFPDIHVEVEEQLSGDIIRAVVDGVADIGIFAAGLPCHGLQVAPYRADQLVILTPNNHPLAERDRVDFRTCLEYDFIGLNRGSSLLDTISNASKKEGIALRLKIQVRSFDAMCEMIAANMGIGVLPLGVCARRLQAWNVKAIPITDRWANRRLLIATNSTREISSSAALLVDRLKSNATC